MRIRKPVATSSRSLAKNLLNNCAIFKNRLAISFRFVNVFNTEWMDCIWFVRLQINLPKGNRLVNNLCRRRQCQQPSNRKYFLFIFSLMLHICGNWMLPPPCINNQITKAFNNYSNSIMCAILFEWLWMNEWIEQNFLIIGVLSVQTGMNVFHRTNTSPINSVLVSNYNYHSIPVINEEFYKVFVSSFRFAEFFDYENTKPSSSHADMSVVCRQVIHVHTLLKGLFHYLMCIFTN